MTLREPRSSRLRPARPRPAPVHADLSAAAFGEALRDLLRGVGIDVRRGAHRGPRRAGDRRPLVGLEALLPLLLVGGAAGKRSALPNSRIMIHQPSQGGGGRQATEIEIQAREILFLKERIVGIYAAHTGQERETLERDMDRDRFMSPVEARDYGLIDAVLEPGTARIGPASGDGAAGPAADAPGA